MKGINLRVISKVLRGLLDGSLVLQAVPTGKSKSPKFSLGRKTVGKPGRKALSPSAKKIRMERTKKRKIREFKNALPEPSQVFDFLFGKSDGEKLSVISRKFNSKRSLLRVLLDKLVKKGDLDHLKGTYFLSRRIRRKDSVKEKKPAPVSEKQVVEFLKQNKAVTLNAMAKGFGAKYQKFIRVVNRLVDTGKVKKDGKNYRLTA